jgi:hypothetical protein
MHYMEVSAMARPKRGEMISEETLRAAGVSDDFIKSAFALERLRLLRLNRDRVARHRREKKREADEN